jgi:hypothetical protein
VNGTGPALREHLRDSGLKVVPRDTASPPAPVILPVVVGCERLLKVVRLILDR